MIWSVVCTAVFDDDLVLRFANVFIKLLVLSFY